MRAGRVTKRFVLVFIVITLQQPAAEAAPGEAPATWSERSSGDTGTEVPVTRRGVGVETEKEKKSDQQLLEKSQVWIARDSKRAQTAGTK